MIDTSSYNDDLYVIDPDIDWTSLDLVIRKSDGTEIVIHRDKKWEKIWKKIKNYLASLFRNGRR